jgi:hypothetical protein
MQLFGLHPGDARVWRTLFGATLQAFDHPRRRSLNVSSDVHCNEQPHTWSILLTMSSAACEA